MILDVEEKAELDRLIVHVEQVRLIPPAGTSGQS